MAQVVRVGDVNTAGGAVISGHGNCLVNYRPAARQGSTVTAHPPCPRPPIHCAAKAAFPGKITVLINGIPMLKTGDSDTCGHTRASGSSNVMVL